MRSLNQRAEVILSQLVTTYITSGQPISSNTLAELPAVGVSSATIRNVMADLEELGFIAAPHTSSGRIPTVKGYRFFVNHFVQAQKINIKTMKALTGEFTNHQDPEQILRKASELVSEFTQFAGVIVLPNQSVSKFHQLEFLRLSDTRILTILVTEDGRVQNRVITMTQEFSISALTEAANFFNRRYKGYSLQEVKRLIINDMKSDNDEMHRINQAAITAASQLIVEEEHRSDGVRVSGEQRLLNAPDLRDISMLQKLFDTLNTKRDLLDLLDKSMHAAGVSIFIGEESGYSALGECSVIASPYKIDGEVIGTIGVIGPTRMAYNEVVSVVDVTAKLVSQSLSKVTR